MFVCFFVCFFRTAIREFKAIQPRTNPAPTQFHINNWVSLLENHPSTEFAQYIINGLSNGFEIRRNGQLPTDIQRNLPTNNKEKLHITRWLIQGLQDGHFIGPFKKPPFKHYFVSPVGTVPKDITKLRTIHHLSAPRDGISVNSEIPDNAKAVTYISFKQIVTWIHALGTNAYIWKIDLANAYRQIALRPNAIPLLGIKWKGLYVFDCRGPFGLASMPAIFQSFGDAFLFCIITKHNSYFYTPAYPLHSIHHLLDDFFGGHPICDTATKQFTATLQTAKHLGIETSEKKCFAPAQNLIILGYEYNTCDQTVSIPSAKVLAILQLITNILTYSRIEFRAIQSLVGKLRWLCSIFPIGAAFVRRLEALIDFTKPGHFKTRLNTAARQDLFWWHDILSQNNRLTRPLKHFLTSPEDATQFIYSDASTTGLGAIIYPQQRVFSSINTCDIPSSHDIMWREMFAVILAAYTWKNYIKSQWTIFYCDNEAVVHMLIKRCAPQSRKDLQQLIRIFCFLCDATPFHFWIQHIPGDRNTIADSLSRHPIVPNTYTNIDNTIISTLVPKLLQCNNNFVSLFN